MTSLPSASTPHVTGESCGPPSAFVVSRIARWRVDRNSTTAARSTVSLVAMLPGIPRRERAHGRWAARSGLAPARPEFPGAIEDPVERPAIRFELLVVSG